MAPHSLLSPAVLTGSPRSPEALRGRRLINQGGNGPGSSSPTVPALCGSPYSCSLSGQPNKPLHAYPAACTRAACLTRARADLGRPRTSSSDFQRQDTGNPRGTSPLGLPPGASLFLGSSSAGNPMQAGISHRTASPKEELGEHGGSVLAAPMSCMPRVSLFTVGSLSFPICEMGTVEPILTSA